MSNPSLDGTTLATFLAARGCVAVPLVSNAVGHFEVAAAALDDAPLRVLVDAGASHTVIDGAAAARRSTAPWAATCSARARR